MSRKRAAYTPPLRSNMDDKHASLMQDYLLLQDEYVSLKDQLQTAKLRKTTLLAEVRRWETGGYVSEKSPLYGDVSNEVSGAGDASESPILETETKNAEVLSYRLQRKRIIFQDY
ncbi:uncharacterized protein LOC131060662 isoform X2 [Cryptomeria japonica]|uniref:uncharacterized protein LOC131060662 isoform X2 n=1 Tax=Cryptomeria japonica TaxID=3369 RepID=UPI0025AB75E7|nr:uncharacterized protein LOC131060662 isoform X2 [Cryptomeria japonica]